MCPYTPALPGPLIAHIYANQKHGRLASCGAAPEAWADAAQVQHEYGETGDLGLVAFNARATQRTMFPLPPLSIASVFQCAALPCALHARLTMRWAHPHVYACPAGYLCRMMSI